MNEGVDVLGLGNSLIDIIAHADDAYLVAQDMAKGAMTLIDEDRAEALYARGGEPSIVSGGSAANTIVGVASFGVKCAYIGKVKHDRSAQISAATFATTGVELRHRAGRARARDRAQLHLRHARRRAHDEHLPRRQHLSFARRRRRGARALGALRLSRRLHVGPAGREGGLSQGGTHRARGGQRASR